MRKSLLLLPCVAAVLALPPATPLHAEDETAPSGTILAEEGEVVPKPCGQGSRTECGSMTTTWCREWKTVEVAIGGGYGPTGGSVKFETRLSCVYWQTTVVKLYKDP